GDRGGGPPPHGDGLYGPSPLPTIGPSSSAEASMSLTQQPSPRNTMEKLLALEMVRVTESAAIAAARYKGRGDRHGADEAATQAMRRTMDDLDISATIVIGEGERDEAPMLYIGEQLGRRENEQGTSAPEVD